MTESESQQRSRALGEAPVKVVKIGPIVLSRPVKVGESFDVLQKAGWGGSCSYKLSYDGRSLVYEAVSGEFTPNPASQIISWSSRRIPFIGHTVSIYGRR